MLNVSFRGQSSGYLFRKHMTKPLKQWLNRLSNDLAIGWFRKGIQILLVRLESTLWKVKTHGERLLGRVHYMQIANPIFQGAFMVCVRRVQKELMALKWSSFLLWWRNRYSETHYASLYDHTSIDDPVGYDKRPSGSHRTKARLDNFSRSKMKWNIGN